MFRRKQVLAHDFAQPALESIAFDRAVSMSRNNDPHPRKRERGSAHPDREMPGSYDFPLYLNSTDVSAASNALRPRVAQARFTRRRTWTEALPSGASAPFCGDD